NEFGQILASRENGPLLLILDKDHDGVFETVHTYCDQVKNCQGILALNGEVFVSADGPDGAAVYRLSDEDRDSQAEKVVPLIRFAGTIGEHGPHGLSLGPDGMLYVVTGNHTNLHAEQTAYAETSPLAHFHDGDLLTPRYEDPSGHAAGITGPGGTVLRTSVQGGQVELVAGGLRNAYDLAFDAQGEVFTYDSDMEANKGTPWYRPIRLQHVVPGGDYGWRSGWARFAPYFPDALPATYYGDRGSPTGMVFYNHVKYPVRFQGALFSCDWSQGRINVLHMEPNGGSYRVESQVFVEGRPLNVTDIAVGPDGWLYFCTGGRDTEGGIYCVTWKGAIPPQVTDFGTGINAALRQPQLDSAWARQAVAKIKQELGPQWAAQLNAVAKNPQRGYDERLRALELMQLTGPFPTTTLLLELVRDENELVRKKAAYLMGIHSNEIVARKLIELLHDPYPAVRRQACESLVRSGYNPPADDLIPLLGDSDRFVAYAAARAIERVPQGEWQTKVIENQRLRIFLIGSIALLGVDGSAETSLAVVRRAEEIVAGDIHEPGKPEGFVSDIDFTMLLRVCQIALTRAGLESKDVPELQRLLATEYPSTDPLINRELVRTLVYLQEPSITSRLIEQLDSDIPVIEKIHIAACAPFLKAGWTSEEKMSLLSFYHNASKVSGGANIKTYMEQFSRDFAVNLDEVEYLSVIEHGERWPATVMAILPKLPAEPSKRVLGALMRLDAQLDAQPGEKEEIVTRVQTGIVAILGRSRDPKGMEHLRHVFETQPDRRLIVTAGLAQAPDEPNWSLLVRSLPILEGAYAREVMTKLATVDRAPQDPEILRQLILTGLRLKDEGGQQAIDLLAYWTSNRLHTESDTWETGIAKWQQWFAKTYPELPPVELPTDSEDGKWTYDQLLAFLQSPEAAQSNSHRGEAVFERAQCVKCHRYGDRGEGMGPDLTTVARRFHTKEILQSIVFPSHVISDQYVSKKIVTEDGRVLAGIVSEAGDEFVVLTSTGEKVHLPKDEVEDMAASNTSAMPDGLLDALTLEEIADLFAYMQTQPRTSITSRRDKAPK
ncbi:MAG: HEAT repeat domain-containing protein, partial [Planctomycetales bacterium]|nr:HEAT repeat domain-containing protein [Planctomycetales bacterium]